MKEIKLTLKEVLILRDIFVSKSLGVEFYPYQRDVSDVIIVNLLTRSGEEVPVEISRQAGKTEAVVCTVAFLMVFAKTLTKRFWGYEAPIRIIIFAPQKEQVKTDFDRLKLYLGRLSKKGKWGDLVDKAESNQTTLQIKNGSYCYIFPLTPTSNPESKSADLIIYEEAHKLVDSEKKNKAEPMGASTNAPEISIGVAWYTKNYFKRLIDDHPKHPRYPATEVIKQRRKMYELTGEERHLLYERKFNKMVERDGLDDSAIKTQWLLKWVLEAGQFMQATDWDKMIGSYESWVDGKKEKYFAKLTDEDKKSECFAGIDTAKSVDSTIITIVRWNPVTRWKELIAILELKGTNYSDQFTIISGFDTVAGKWTGKGMFQFFNVVAVAIDSTGQGDFMPDMFERHTKWRDERSGLFRVKFSMQSKDVIYTNLDQVILNNLTALPDPKKCDDDDKKQLEKMRKQMLDLVKEYKGQFMSVHHPEGSENGEVFHDDYPDSWALAEYAYSLRQRIARPKITVI